MSALHLIGFPHTRIDSRLFSTCAYTGKVARMRRMTFDLPLTVYGTEGSDVVILNEDERHLLFGPDDPSRLPAWPNLWTTFNERAIAAVRERAEPRDLLLLAGGYSQKPIADALPDLLAVEPFVGYEGIFTPFCAFESNAWRHYLYGKLGIQDGRWYDRVIPNYFELGDFPFGDGDGEYLLYVGRLIGRKGPHVAAEIAKAVGMPLVVAGPGAVNVKPGRIVADEVTIEGDVMYAGTVDAETRAALMGGAAALLAPTVYLEPFGGVAAEAMLCGTPAVTTPWGAFSETVEPGLTGYHFSTLQEGIDAVEAALSLDRHDIRRRAISRFSVAAVQPEFEAWFDALTTLYEAGWYQRREEPCLA